MDEASFALLANWAFLRALGAFAALISSATEYPAPKQNPMDGRKRSRSATMVPTGKNKLEAGTYRMMVRARLQSKTAFRFFKEYQQMHKIDITSKRVPKFLKSVNVVMCLTQGQPQSYERLKGKISFRTYIVATWA